jgi:uncharacterized protein DUF6308
MASRALILRGGVVDDPLTLALAFVERYLGAETRDTPQPMSFDERDLRLANRGGARIAASEIAAVLERRGEIVRALRMIRPDASLAGPAAAMPWTPLRRLFDGFADIRGIGFSKMTKALHPKRPALIPMLDSVVQAYLGEHPAMRSSPFADRAIAFVRSYKRELDSNNSVLRGLRRELARRGYELTEVRLLDVLIWSVSADV